jgi:NTE family protein
MTFDRRACLRGLAAPSALALLAPLVGCAAFNDVSPDAPLALPQPRALDQRPRLALVLGSGGPRGYAHIGVLRVLEEAGIQPDVVVGSSVGALLGVFWASGMSAARIDTLSQEGGPLTLFDPNPFADRGWIRGQKLQDYVNGALRLPHASDPQLQNLPRRVVVVATRRSDKQARFFMDGNAGVAVRASSAVPGVFSPVGIQGVEYEDADESLPVAVSAARALGAGFVIAVDVSALEAATPPDAPPAMRERDLARRQRIAPETAKADFLVHPDLGYYASPRRSYFEFSRTVGERTARALLPALQAKLAHVTGARRP